MCAEKFNEFMHLCTHAILVYILMPTAYIYRFYGALLRIIEIDKEKSYISEILKAFFKYMYVHIYFCLYVHCEVALLANTYTLL